MDDCITSAARSNIDLRKALLAGEFELHYQPLVNLGDNEHQRASRR